VSAPKADRLTLAERLARLPPDKRTLALSRLAERGIVVDLDPGPVPLADPSGRLSVKQELLWRLHQGGDRGAFYHVGVVGAFAPSVDPLDLASAYSAAASAFQAPRTAFPADSAGNPVAEVQDSTPGPSIHRLDASSRSEADRLISAYAASAGRRPFVFDRPPIRAVVLDARPHRVALAVLAHDILLDHYGLRTVLLPAVEAVLAGRPVEPERISMTDFAAWQRSSLISGQVAQQRERRRMSAAKVLRLPAHTDRRGQTEAVPVPPGLRIDQLAADLGVTVPAAALAAWHTALTEWSGRADVPIGCCTTGRHRPELRQTVGNLANTVVIQPDSWTSVRDAHRELTSALSDADAPFETVLDAERPVQDEHIVVRFTFHESGLPGETWDVPFGYAKSALSAEIRQVGTELAASIDYRPAVLAGQDVRTLAGLFAAALIRASTTSAG
jgi:hypothetical protein